MVCTPSTSPTMPQVDENEQNNQVILRDCLSAQIVCKTRLDTDSATKSKKKSRPRKGQSGSTPLTTDDDDATELADFVDV